MSASINPPSPNADYSRCLALPPAWGDRLGTAGLKQQAADFRVQELLGFEPSGSGEHVFLHLEKTGLTSADVVRALAKLSGKSQRDIGYAGLKDKHAITRQWFSVATTPAEEPDWSQLSALMSVQEGQRLSIVDQTRHTRKLRVGAHRGNQFSLRLVRLDADTERLLQRLENIRRGGFPNYFGLQRFGFGGANLRKAERWFRDGVRDSRQASRKPSRQQRSLMLSAARSGLFNALLAQRVDDANWCAPLAGDVFQLNRSGSVFCAGSDADHAELDARLASQDIHVSAPLWGTGKSMASAAAAAQERLVTQAYPALTAGLEAADVAMQRRALRATADNFSWDIDADNLLLDFELFRGSYATVLVNELLETAVNVR